MLVETRDQRSTEYQQPSQHELQFEHMISMKQELQVYRLLWLYYWAQVTYDRFTGLWFFANTTSLQLYDAEGIQENIKPAISGANNLRRTRVNHPKKREGTLCTILTAKIHSVYLLKQHDDCERDLRVVEENMWLICNRCILSEQNIQLPSSFTRLLDVSNVL